MVAASTAGRTSCVRMMWAPARIAATLEAVVALIRSGAVLFGSVASVGF